MTLEWRGCKPKDPLASLRSNPAFYCWFVVVTALLLYYVFDIALAESGLGEHKTALLSGFVAMSVFFAFYLVWSIKAPWRSNSYATSDSDKFIRLLMYFLAGLACLILAVGVFIALPIGLRMVSYFLIAYSIVITFFKFILPGLEE